MAQGNYGPTPMLDVFEMLGRVEDFEGLSTFQHRKKGNLETLRLMSDSTPLCVNPQALKERFYEKISPDQQVFWDVNQTVDPGVGTNFVRIGDGGNNRVTVELVPQTAIQEGFAISRVNESLSRFNSYSMETRVRMTMAFNTAQALQNAMVRAEAQAQAYIDANKWAGGGLGTKFPAAGDYKQIPAGDDIRVFWKINQEARENKLKVAGNDGFYFLGSDGLEYAVGITEGFANANQENLTKSIENIEFFVASELEPPAPLTEEAVFYSIMKGGVGMYMHAHRFGDENEELNTGEDQWMNMQLPNMPMFEGIDTSLVQVQCKGFKGFEDTFATYANNESRIDLIEAMSYVITPYYFRSYDPGTRRPIVGYTKLSS